MIITIIKHLDLLPQPEATEVTTMETLSVTQLPTTQTSNETGHRNHSSYVYAAETPPPSNTFMTSPTPQVPSSSTTDIHRNSLILIITVVMVMVITYLKIQIDVQHDTMI